MQKKILFYGISVFLILLSILATVKICFFNMNIDEGYAITLSCRILSEDRMFLEIWEPHQTSGFLTAGLCWLYRTFTGTTEYMVLYLRVCGALLQAAISVFMYRTLKDSFSRYGALVSAVFFYNTLPKQIQTPEFANMLVWFSVLTMLCLFRACHMKHSRLWLGAAGVCLCGLVLSYPSCILAVPAYVLCLKKLRPKSFFRDAGILAAVCALLGGGYLAFFLSHMTLPQFLFGLRQMMTDGFHSASLSQRLAGYGRELWGFLPHLCALVLLSWVFTLLYCYVTHKRRRRWPLWYFFSCCLLCVSYIEQIIIWLGDSLNFHYPLLYFYLLYGVGIGACQKKRSLGKSQYRTLFWAGSVCGGFVWFTALLVTNTTLSVTGSYLASGLIPAILLLADGPDLSFAPPEGNPYFYKWTMVSATMGLLAVTLFAKGFMVCENQGLRSNIFFVRQKALSGPAKNIYYAYLNGYAYNSYADLLEDCCTPEDSLLYVGVHSLYYLLTDSRIAVPSTISTPTFDGRLLEYWSLFPERYPTLVVIDLSYYNTAEIDFIVDCLHLQKPVAGNGEFTVYRTESPLSWDQQVPGYDENLFSGVLSDINRSVHWIHKKGYQPLKMAVCKL